MHTPLPDGSAPDPSPHRAPPTAVAPVDGATAFLTALAGTAAHAPTACTSWTAHDLVAHLAAGAAEMASLTEAAVAGLPARATAGFAAREAPFTAMDDERLRARLVTEALRLDAAVGALEERGGHVSFSGRLLSPADLRMHGRSEAALHRWDLAGDDDVGDALLAGPELTAHAVKTLNAMLGGSPEDVTQRVLTARLGPGRLAFAAPGQPDVVLVVDDGGSRLELAEPSPAPVATADPATRLLALWGRRSPGRHVTWDGDDGEAGALAAFLWAPAGAAHVPGGAPGPTPLSETR